MAKFTISQADFQLEAGFSQAEFSLFRETSSLLDHLFKALAPHGARLTDLRVERGNGSVGDYHVLCYLFNYWVTLRVRVDRIEIIGSQMPQEYVHKYGVAIVDALQAVRTCRQDLSYRAYALVVGLHGLLEGMSVAEYLAKFVKNVPDGLGPSVGSGTVMYFGPAAERLLCSVTVDRSAVVADSLFCRTHIIWDATKVKIEGLPDLAKDFVRQAVNGIGLELPT